MKRSVHGGDVSLYPGCVDYSSSSNPLGTPPGVIRAAKESLKDLRSYPQPYARDLCRAIAAREGVEESCVTCSNGASQLLMTLCKALSPQRALIGAPCFSEYERAVEAVGGEVSFFDRPLEREGEGEAEAVKDREGEGEAEAVKEREGEGEAEAVKEREWEKSFLRRVRGEEKHSPAPDLVILCNPNNPDGYLYDQGFLQQVLWECQSRGIFFLLDECFLDLSPEGEGMSLAPFLKGMDHLVILRAFTKTYALASLRLGYCLASPSLSLRLEEHMQPWEVSGVALSAGLAALEEKDYCHRSRQVVLRERERLTQGLWRLGWRCCPSHANFLLFQGPVGLMESCIQRGYLIRDASNFRGLAPGWYRICVRTGEENEGLLRAFGQIQEEISKGGNMMGGKSMGETSTGEKP